MATIELTDALAALNPANIAASDDGTLDLRGGDAAVGGGAVRIIAGSANTPGFGGGGVTIRGGDGYEGQGGSVSITGGFGDGQVNGTLSIQTFSNIFIHGLPTADPHIVDALWNSAGTLKISAG